MSCDTFTSRQIFFIKILTIQQYITSRSKELYKGRKTDCVFMVAGVDTLNPHYIAHQFIDLFMHLFISYLVSYIFIYLVG